MLCTVSRQLPPRKVALRIITPRTIAPRTIASEENCSPDNCPPRTVAPEDNYPPPRPPPIIVPGLLLPGSYSKDNCPLTIYPWKLPPRNIAFRMICRLHNCLSDKWPRGKLPSRKIVLRINYTRDIFSQESEIAVL